MLPWQIWKRNRALKTDDPYEACIAGITEHPNYGNCLKCSKCDYCKQGILQKHSAGVEETIKISRAIKNGEKLTDEQLRTFMSEDEINDLKEYGKILKEVDELLQK